MKKVIMAVLSLWSAACADSVSEAVSFEQMGREALTGLAASIKACSPVVIGTVMFFLIGSAGSASSIINRLLGT